MSINILDTLKRIFGLAKAEPVPPPEQTNVVQLPLPTIEQLAEMQDTVTKERTGSISRDFSKLTDYEYDFICSAYDRRTEYNSTRKRKDHKTVDELVVELNTALGKNKSRRYYTRIWGTGIDRDDPRIKSTKW